MKNSDILSKLKNKKIGVLYGGFSCERDVSLVSGKVVLNTLRKMGVNACGIDVDRNVSEKIRKAKIDIACVFLHGQFGEDGAIQGLLEVLGVPYTGSGVFASSVSMDKDISKQLFRRIGILTPDWVTLRKYEREPEIKTCPVVVKPVSQGSAIGVTIVKSAVQFAAAAKKAFKYDKEIMVESFVAGTEIAAGVLDGNALPVIEIVPKGKFYDFKSKYQKGGSRHIIPARISDKAYKTAQHYAESIYKNFKCSAMCRVDMIVGKNDDVWVLENNTIPGMTETSLLPDASRAVGYNFESLVLKIVESAL